jgi:hypothetical protein
MGTWLGALAGVVCSASIGKGDIETRVGMTVGAGMGALAGTWNVTDGASIGVAGGSAANWGGQARALPGTVLVVEQRGRDLIGTVRWGSTSIDNAEGRTATSIVMAFLFQLDDGGAWLP